MNPLRNPVPLVLVLTAACRVGPDYKAPELTAPQAWSESAPATAAGAVEPRWWRLFGDPILDALVERALASNHDLRIATARIREVRARYGIAESALLPALDAGGKVERQVVGGDGKAADAAELLQQDRRTVYSSGFDARWELDLFGGNARALEAAGADVEVAEEERRTVQVTLLGELGRSYVELRGAQRQLEVFRASARTASETLDLTERLRASGLATELDLARARAQRADLASEIPRLEASIRQAIHRLSFLLGQEPDALVAELAPAAPLPSVPTTVLVGVPSDLVRRRPDVRRDERALAAATARIGVATAELYPSVSLSAALGLEALGASELLHGDTRFSSLGSSLHLPVFSGGRIRARIAAEGAATERALAAYERSYLGALGEVEDALVAFARELERRQSLAEAAEAGRRAAALARELFEGGLTTFLDTLDAERVSYKAEERLAQSETAIATDLVRLYKALGGGWELDAAAEAQQGTR